MRKQDNIISLPRDKNETKYNSKFLPVALTTVCLWPEITFIFRQKTKTPSVLIPTSLS